jgi:hypothetical protein
MKWYNKTINRISMTGDGQLLTSINNHECQLEEVEKKCDRPTFA